MQHTVIHPCIDITWISDTDNLAEGCKLLFDTKAGLTG